ncbi:MAG TPA: tyrosine-type recombinase/integrase [Anaerolineae bacterium]|nr:tyrosine-type recombinase/integrase [Anaerolineae bacterium]
MKKCIQDFIVYLDVRKGRAKNTLLAYRADLTQMADVVSSELGSELHPEDISKDCLKAYVDWLTQREFRPATISRKMAALRCFLEYISLVERRCEHSLVDTLKPPAAPRKPPRVLTQDEVNALLDAPTGLSTARGRRDAAILALLYATGLRATDTIALQVSDIDLDTGMISLPLRAGVRLPLNVAREPLHVYLYEGRPNLEKHPQEQALFLNQRGRRLSRQGLWLVVKHWAGVLGLGDEVSPHTLRHTLANHLLCKGLSTREVQRMLGLSSPTAIRLIREAALTGEDGARREAIPQS